MVIRAPRPLPRVGEMETTLPTREWTVVRLWELPPSGKLVKIAQRQRLVPDWSLEFCVYVETEHGLLHGPDYRYTREGADEVFDIYVRFLATQLTKRAGI